MPKISIIIPIYNAGKYLQACLDSVLMQTFGDFEVICVNDGSQDNCAEILSEYAAKDKRIKVITQENQGVSAARNQALRRANGKYITFLDADDMVSPHFLDRMFAGMEQNPEADFAWCSFVKGEREPIFNGISKTPEIYIDPFAHYFLHQKPKIESSVWAKMFRKEILENLEFPIDQSYGEDLVVLYQTLYQARQAIFIPENLFFYRIHPESAMRATLTNRRMNSEMAATEKLERLFRDKPMDKNVRKAFEAFIARRFFNTVFKLPKAEDKLHYKEWRRRYLPVLINLEQKWNFKPYHLVLKKRLQYLWYKRSETVKNSDNISTISINFYDSERKMDV
jgi:glycosyltransferase involved in cell wall biosynthesis